MRPNTCKRTTAALLVSFIAFASVGHAQTEKQNRTDGRPLGIDGPPARFGAGYERLFAVLTEEQRSSLRSAMADERETIRGLEEKLRQARRELFDAGLNPKFDEDLVRNKAMAMAKIEAEMTVVRTRAFSKLQPPLSAEQIAKLKEAPALNSSGDARGESSGRRQTGPRDENDLPVKNKSSAP